MENTITAGTASQIIGVPYHTINRWVLEGLVLPTENPKGSGSLRRFSLRDVIELRLIAALREVGASLKLGHRAVDEFQHWLDAGIPERLWLIARDPSDLTWAEAPEAIAAAASSHTAIILDVAALARETAAAFEQELQAQLASRRRRR